MKHLTVALVAILWAMSGSIVSAAEFSVHANDSPTLNAIAITGRFELGDAFRLKSYISRLPTKRYTAAYLNSEGGNYVEGLEIGRFFRKAGIRTVTEGRGAICFSACAFAFLGGYDFQKKSPWRTKASTSQLGFHSYFIELDKEVYSQQEVEALLSSSQYSALLLVDYFREVGADARILSAALSKGSSELFMISNADALEAGINIWDEEKSEMVFSEKLARFLKE